MAYPKLLSFAELVQGRDSSVRVTDDGLLDMVDLTMVVHGSARNYASQVILRIPDNVFDSKKIIERQLNPRGHKTKLLTFQDAIEFVMVLPGQTAMAVRQQFARIIREYIAGERSLIAEINANAESNSPLAQMARAAAPTDETMLGFKRRREELELFKLEEEIRAMARTRLANLKNDLEDLADPAATKLDERTRLMFKDSYMNLLMTPSVALGQQAQLTNGSSPSPNTPISISGVAASIGYKPTTNDAKRIGVDIRKRYIKEHGKPPPKHDQLCDGRVTLVNSYSEQDRPLVEEALHAYFKPCENSDGE